MWVCVFFLAICAWRADAASTGEPQDGHQLFRRDYTFDQNSGGWLKFYPMPVKWEEAVLRCHHEGSVLASPLNEKVSEALTTVMVDHGLTTVPMFTGISNTYATSEYQSMEGVPISDMCLVWSAKPNVEISKDICIAMYANGTATAVSCADRHPFVCYRQKGVNKLNKCGTADPEYRFYSETGSCYKKYTKGLKWSEAFKRCSIDGAHLAVINSQAEAKILWQLTGIRPVFIGARAWSVDDTRKEITMPEQSKMFNCSKIYELEFEEFMEVVDRCTQEDFIDYNKPTKAHDKDPVLPVDDTREWITVQGQSLDEAGYSEWRKDEPNNVGGSENCASIYEKKIEGGVLNAVNCNHVYHFLCEIEAKVGDRSLQP